MYCIRVQNDTCPPEDLIVSVSRDYSVVEHFLTKTFINRHPDKTVDLISSLLPHSQVVKWNQSKKFYIESDKSNHYWITYGSNTRIYCRTVSIPTEWTNIIISQFDMKQYKQLTVHADIPSKQVQKESCVNSQTEFYTDPKIESQIYPEVESYTESILSPESIDTIAVKRCLDNDYIEYCYMDGKCGLDHNLDFCRFHTVKRSFMLGSECDDGQFKMDRLTRAEGYPIDFKYSEEFKSELDVNQKEKLDYDNSEESTKKYESWSDAPCEPDKISQLDQASYKNKCLKICSIIVGDYPFWNRCGRQCQCIESDQINSSEKYTHHCQNHIPHNHVKCYYERITSNDSPLGTELYNPVNKTKICRKMCGLFLKGSKYECSDPCMCRAEDHNLHHCLVHLPSSGCCYNNENKLDSVSEDYPDDLKINADNYSTCELSTGSNDTTEQTKLSELNVQTELSDSTDFDHIVSEQFICTEHNTGDKKYLSAIIDEQENLNHLDTIYLTKDPEGVNFAEYDELVPDNVSDTEKEVKSNNSSVLETNQDPILCSESYIECSICTFHNPIKSNVVSCVICQSTLYI